MNEFDKTKDAARLDQLHNWIEKWHHIKYFGRALGSLGVWVIRIAGAILLLIELGKRVFEK